MTVGIEEAVVCRIAPYYTRLEAAFPESFFAIAETSCGYAAGRPTYRRIKQKQASKTESWKFDYRKPEEAKKKEITGKVE
jgi:peptide methionine sulfoxide reductase MsrA